MKIGNVIKYYRILHRLTQSELAELSGINEKYLGRIERNESVPTIDKLEQLCIAFDIRLCDMLMISPEKIESKSRMVYKQKEIIFPKTEFYCNCCGCTFRSSLSDCKIDELHCPECGCSYNTDNGYIEKYLVY